MSNTFWMRLVHSAIIVIYYIPFSLNTIFLAANQRSCFPGI